MIKLKKFNLYFLYIPLILRAPFSLVYNYFARFRNKIFLSKIKKIENKKNFFKNTIISEKLRYFAGHTITIKKITNCLDQNNIKYNLIDNFNLPLNKKTLSKSETIFINGLFPLTNKNIFNLLKELILNRKIKIYVYLHEGKAAFEYLNKVGMQKITNLLKHVSVVALSEELKNYYVNELGFNCNNIIPESLYFKEIDYFYSSKKTKRKNVINICTLSSLQTRKGLEKVLELARFAKNSKKYQHFLFHWVGAANLSVSKKFENFNSLDSFFWWGQVDGFYKKTLLKKMDIFFHPSLDDPMPLSIYDYLKYKKPIILSEKSGWKDLLDDRMLLRIDTKEASNEKILNSIEKYYYNYTKNSFMIMKNKILNKDNPKYFQKYFLEIFR